MNQYQQLCKLLIELEPLFERIHQPTATVSRRKLLQGLQLIDELAQEVRKEVIQLRESKAMHEHEK